MSVGELADRAGITRRAVRFYVQQKLIDPPLGLGRGCHYEPGHLQQLKRVLALQNAGHSLEEIRQLASTAGPVDGDQQSLHAVPPVSSPKPVSRLPLRATLWRRLAIAEGLELSFDASRFNPSVEDLMRLRDALHAVFLNREDETPVDGSDESPVP